MKGKDLIEGMYFIDEKFVQEAEMETAGHDAKKKGKVFPLHKRWIAAVAAATICAALSVPVLAATVPAVYQMLYNVSPAAAQFFRPVQMSCEDNGIRMGVIAAYIHQDTAEIYISIQDLEGDRFDETIDLFDSYTINTPFDATGTCELVNYAPETKTALFLITIKNWNGQRIEGRKITFSVERFLGHKHKSEHTMTDIDLSKAKMDAQTQLVDLRGMSGELQSFNNQNGAVVLDENNIDLSPVDGVSIHSIGYIRETLRVQVYYEDILKTDNHGFISLKNKETGELLECNGSVSFFDENGSGSYEEYIFDNVPFEMLPHYALYGEFVTSESALEGNWTVTFPMETTEAGA